MPKLVLPTKQINIKAPKCKNVQNHPIGHCHTKVHSTKKQVQNYHQKCSSASSVEKFMEPCAQNKQKQW